MKKNTHGPVIIPRQEHGISRKLMSPNALRILYRLRDNGYIGYLVGGCVRDLLLGREPKDFDVVTSATPNEVKRLFRNCRLIGRRFRPLRCRRKRRQTVNAIKLTNCMVLQQFSIQTGIPL